MVCHNLPDWLPQEMVLDMLYTTTKTIRNRCGPIFIFANGMVSIWFQLQSITAAPFFSTSSRSSRLTLFSPLGLSTIPRNGFVTGSACNIKTILKYLEHVHAFQFAARASLGIALFKIPHGQFDGKFFLGYIFRIQIHKLMLVIGSWFHVAASATRLFLARIIFFALVFTLSTHFCLQQTRQQKNVANKKICIAQQSMQRCHATRSLHEHTRSNQLL